MFNDSPKSPDGCPKWGSPLRGSGKREKREKYGTGKTSQSSQASQYSHTHCAGMVSRMRLVSVQNEADRCPEWGSPLRGSGPACGSRECGIDKLKVMKTVCICPECPKCRDRNGRNGQNGQGEMSKTPMGPIGHIGPICPIKEYAAQGDIN